MFSCMSYLKPHFLIQDLLHGHADLEHTTQIHILKSDVNAISFMIRTITR